MNDKKHPVASDQIHHLKRKIAKNETRIRSLEEQLRIAQILFDAFPDPVFYKDAQGIYRGCNKAFEDFVGFKRADIIGNTVYGIAPTDLALLNEGGHQSYEGNVAYADGTRHDVVFKKATFQNQSGQIAGLIGLIIDMTELKKTEASLREAMAVAETANQLKNEFLANISHEIRTPMNAIIGMSDLLLDSPLDQEQKEYFGVIRNSTDKLLSLIDDILDLSTMESGKIKLNPRSFSPRSVLESVADTLWIRAHKKGVELGCRIDHRVPESLKGDPDRLRQVLINLGENAVKFTGKGEILIDCAIESDSEKRIRLHFKVSDTGVGIPADQLETVFEIFRQVDGSMARKNIGSGLGLTVARKVVQLMKGRIWVESKLGEGSIFHFEAAFDRITQDPGVKEWPELKGRSVLVVGASRLSCAILNDIFHAHSIQARFIVSEKEAMEAIGLDPVQAIPYSAILISLQKSDEEGFDLCRRIRRLPRLDDTRIILLSDTAQKDHAALCRQFAVSGYLLSPIKENEILSALSLALNTGRSIPPQSHPPIPTEMLELQNSYDKKMKAITPVFAPEDGIPLSLALDAETALTGTSGDKMLLSEYLQEFITFSEKELKGLHDSHRKNNFKQIAETMNQLKAAAEPLGAVRLVQAMTDLIKNCDAEQGQDIEKILQRVDSEHRRLAAYANRPEWMIGSEKLQ